MLTPAQCAARPCVRTPSHGAAARLAAAHTLRICPRRAVGNAAFVEPRRLLRPLVLASSVQAEEQSEREDNRSKKVTLGPYKDGALVVEAKKYKFTTKMLEDAELKLAAKTHKFERINFTGSGAKLGHTVKVDISGKYLGGDNEGMPIPGTTAQMFELELREGQPEPWNAFVTAIVENGMGQEEAKSFAYRFPSNFKAEALRDVDAMLTIVVKEIGQKVEIEGCPSAEEGKKIVHERFRLAAERKTDEGVNAAIREALMATSVCDTQKVQDSVSWAKFGPQSMSDYTYHLLCEEIAKLEGIDFEDVPRFLRKHASVTFVSDEEIDPSDVSLE